MKRCRKKHVTATGQDSINFRVVFPQVLNVRKNYAEIDWNDIIVDLEMRILFDGCIELGYFFNIVSVSERSVENGLSGVMGTSNNMLCCREMGILQKPLRGRHRNRKR